MNKFQNSIIMLFALIFALGGNYKALAQQPSPIPEEVFGFYSASDAMLMVEWSISASSQEIKSIKGFNITIKGVNSDGSISEFKNQFLVGDENLRFDEYPGGSRYNLFTELKLESGKSNYYLTVSSFSEQGESAQSKESFIVWDGIEEPYGIYITQYPDYSATLGEKYSSYIKAETFDESQVIKYELLEGPEGMTINSKSGLIEFTPQSSGYLYYSIRISYLDDPNVAIEHIGVILVNNCKTLGTIKGKLTYNEEFVESNGGIIFFFQMYDKEDFDNLIQVGAVDVSNEGDFSIQLDKGEYIAYFHSYEFFGGKEDFINGEWYRDALKIQDATPIIVDCGEVTNITWDVGDQQSYNKYRVSGYVNLDDGTPLPNSGVSFEADLENQDIFWGGYYKGVYTDQNGYYEAELPDVFKYRAYAYSVTDDGTYTYRQQYWENTYNPMEATLLTLDGDITGINFTFKKADFEQPDGSVSGSVVNINDEPIEGAFVIGFLVKALKEEDSRDLFEGFAAITDENGDFRFSYMPFGDYVFFAFPNNSDFSPGFFRVEDIASLTWDDASIVQHDGFNTISNIKIKLPNMEEIEGVGKIEGQISSAGGGIKNDDQGVALSGASIFLVNQNGNTNKYEKSSSNGNYKLVGIAPGTYQFIVDKVGYVSHKEFVEVGPDGVISGHNVSLQPEGTSSVDEPITFSAQVFPNPTNASTVNLGFIASNSSASIEIYDMLGIRVFSNKVSTQIGYNLISVNIEAIANGQYVLKINDGNSLHTSTMMISR